MPERCLGTKHNQGGGFFGFFFKLFTFCRIGRGHHIFGDEVIDPKVGEVSFNTGRPDWPVGTIELWKGIYGKWA